MAVTKDYFSSRLVIGYCVRKVVSEVFLLKVTQSVRGLRHVCMLGMWSVDRN